MLRGFLLLVALLPRSVSAGEPIVLRVGMETRHPPWAFVPGATPDLRKPPSLTSDEARRLQGFDVDVMNALGRRLGARMQVVPTVWSELEAGLLARRFDLILCAWTPTAQTSEAILPTAPYGAWGLLIVTRADDPRVRSYADLDGIRVGHLSDPAVDAALGAMGAGRFQVFDLQEPLFAALRSGALDAVIYDSLYVRWRVAREPGLRIVGAPLNRLGYHVGVRREDRALFGRVQAAVRELAASPEREQIRQKWEGR